VELTFNKIYFISKYLKTVSRITSTRNKWTVVYCHTARFNSKVVVLVSFHFKRISIWEWLSRSLHYLNPWRSVLAALDLQWHQRWRKERNTRDGCIENLWLIPTFSGGKASFLLLPQSSGKCGCVDDPVSLTCSGSTLEKYKETYRVCLQITIASISKASY